MTLESTILSLYSIAANPSWSTAVGAPIYNWDYKDKPASYPFLKYTIVFKKADKPDFTNKELSGLVVIGIFTKTGQGQLASAELADKLDVLFQDKLINGIQLGSSFLQPRGIDPDDNTLVRDDYTVPFTYFGEK